MIVKNNIERRAMFEKILKQYKKGRFNNSIFYKKVHDLFWEDIPPLEEALKNVE